jgi:hypothetical protein
MRNFTMLAIVMLLSGCAVETEAPREALAKRAPLGKLSAEDAARILPTVKVGEPRLCDEKTCLDPELGTNLDGVSPEDVPTIRLR